MYNDILYKWIISMGQVGLKNFAAYYSICVPYIYMSTSLHAVRLRVIMSIGQ